MDLKAHAEHVVHYAKRFALLVPPSHGCAVCGNGVRNISVRKMASRRALRRSLFIIAHSIVMRIQSEPTAMQFQSDPVGRSTALPQ